MQVSAEQMDLTSTENTWNSIFESYVKPFSSELLLWCNFATNLLNIDMPKLYEDVITSWHSFIENSLPEDVPVQFILKLFRITNMY